jgi:hypothetical protein
MGVKLEEGLTQRILDDVKQRNRETCPNTSITPL